MEDCQGCFYARTRQYTPNSTRLECRADTPKAGGTIGIWPSVRPDDWCGKWEPVQSEPPTKELAKVSAGYD